MGLSRFRRIGGLLGPHWNRASPLVRPGRERRKFAIGDESCRRFLGLAASSFLLYVWCFSLKRFLPGFRIFS